MLAYLDAMMSDYSMSFHHVMHEFPLPAGLKLMEARHERLAPGTAAAADDRAAMRAVDAERARISREFTILD